MTSTVKWGPPATMEGQGLLGLKLLTSISDEEFIKYVQISSCKWLSTSECTGLTDAAMGFRGSGLRHTPQLNQVPLLALSANFCTQLTDNALLGIASSCKKLKMISLDGVARLTDTGLGYLAAPEGCRELQVVSLRYTSIGDRGVDSLARGLPRLKSLSLDYTQVTDISLYSLANFISDRLLHLDLTACVKITDAGIVRLVGRCGGLHYLSLSECPLIGESSITNIASSLFSLTHLKLSGLSRITDRAVHTIETHCRSLLYLDISFCQNVKNPTHFAKYTPLPVFSGRLPPDDPDLHGGRRQGSLECCQSIRSSRAASNSLPLPSWSSFLSSIQRGADSSPLTPGGGFTTPPMGHDSGGTAIRRKGFLPKNTKVEFVVTPPYILAKPDPTSSSRSGGGGGGAGAGGLPQSRKGTESSASASACAISSKVRKGISVHGKISRNHLNGLYDILYFLPPEPKCKPSQIRIPAGDGGRYVKGKMTGEQVEVNYREHGSWVLGRVTKERTDSGTFDVTFPSLCEQLEVPEGLILVGGMTVDGYLTSETHGPNSIHSQGAPVYIGQQELAGRAWLQRRNSAAIGRSVYDEPREEESGPLYLTLLRT